MKPKYKIAIDRAVGVDLACLVVGKITGDKVEILEEFSSRDPKKFDRKIEMLKLKYGATVIESK